MNVVRKHSEQGNCPTRLRFTFQSERNINSHFISQGYLLFVSSFVVSEILKSTYYCHIAYEYYIHTIRWNRHSILLNLRPFLPHRFHNLSLGKRRDHIRYRVSKATANHLLTAAMLNYEVENQAIESRHPNATTMFDQQQEILPISISIHWKETGMTCTEIPDPDDMGLVQTWFLPWSSPTLLQI